MTLGYVTLDDPNVVSIDVAMALAVEKFQIPLTLTGGSGFGWSRSSTLQACPYKYYRKYVKPLPIANGSGGRPAAALQVGGAFHAFMALYYQRMIDFEAGRDPVPEPADLCDALLELRADAVLVNEAWRLFDAYAAYYESIGDYLKPLAVEQWAKDKKGIDTCRYDLIAEVLEGSPQGIIPGTYVVEHKSAGRMDRSVTEGWHLDGEIMGQIMLWKKAGMSKRFGPLEGVIVNIVTKSKVPNFHREIVAPPLRHARHQARDLKVLRSIEGVYRVTNTWPRHLHSCWGRYGPCQFWDHCRDER